MVTLAHEGGTFQTRRQLELKRRGKTHSHQMMVILSTQTIFLHFSPALFWSILELLANDTDMPCFPRREGRPRKQSCLRSTRCLQNMIFETLMGHLRMDISTLLMGFRMGPRRHRLGCLRTCRHLHT